MRVTVVAFGKLKTPGMKEAAEYYRKLCGSWTRLEEIELKPFKVHDKGAIARKRVQDEEAVLLLERLESHCGSDSKGRREIFLLDELGENFSTLEWSRFLDQQEQKSLSHLVFCIGSSLGFGDEVRKRANKRTLSLGRQTFPHELSRVALYEQIYRAYSVLRGHPYHNEGI